MKYNLKTLLVIIAFIGMMTAYINLYRSYRPRQAPEIPQNNLVVKSRPFFFTKDRQLVHEVYLTVQFPDHDECYISNFDPDGKHELTGFRFHLRKKKYLENLEYQRIPDESLRTAMQRRHMQVLKILDDQHPLGAIISMDKESHELYVPSLTEKLQPTPLPENLALLAYPKESAEATCYWCLAKSAELLVQLHAGTVTIEPYPRRR